MYIRFVYSEVHKTRNTRQWTFIALLFRVHEIFAGFLFSKTSANKRLFIYMSANGCIATVCKSGIYAARPLPLTTQDVSNRKSTTNVWIVQMIMKNYYIDNAMSSMRHIVARAAHKAVLCATICLTVWQDMYYQPCMYRVSTVYQP